MKKIFKSISLAILGFALAWGVNLQAQDNQVQDNSLLYRIEGNGIEASYLFGTMHLVPQKDFKIEDKVKEAFQSADIIALEIDMDDPNMPLQMMQNMAMKEGMTLDKLLSEEDYKKLDEELKRLAGVGVAQFNTMKPFFIATLLISDFVGEQPASFEGTFVEMATAEEKEIVGLETVEEQMTIFDKIPYKDQAEDISEMINDNAEMENLFAKMVELYKKEDAEGLYKVFAEYYEEDEDDTELELMLDDRNENWIPRMGELAKEQSVFFGVGAGHLGGEKGVLNLLTKAGYTVTPIAN